MRDLFNFTLIGLSLVLSSDLLLHTEFSSNKSVSHTSGIQKLSLEPDVGVLVWVFPLTLVSLHSLLHVSGLWVSKDSLANVGVSVVLQVVVLVSHEVGNHTSGVDKGIVSGVNKLLELSLLDFQKGNSLLKVTLHLVDLLSVLMECFLIGLLVNLEVKLILLQNLAWSLLGQSSQNLSDLSLLSSKDLELFRVDKVVELSELLHKSLQKVSSLIDKIVLFVSPSLLLWNSGNVNSWPSLMQHRSQGKELIESSSTGEFSILVNTSD